MPTATRTDWRAFAREIVPAFAERAADADADVRFVHENYARLREGEFFAAAVPAELGGGGASVAELADVHRLLAHGCASTALAASMHTHVVAATAWKWRHSEPAGDGDRPRPGEALLRRLVDEQPVLLSTGGTDWIPSNGSMERVDGGYRVRARKVFGSGAPAADLIVTSARYEKRDRSPNTAEPRATAPRESADPLDPAATADHPDSPAHPDTPAQVLHFAVPVHAEGVRILDDWNGTGMRGTGSCTVLLEDVFVPDDAVQLARPADRWHPMWSVIGTIALPIFLATYVGIAEKARDLAVEAVAAKDGARRDVDLLGEIDTALATARLAWEDMVRRADDHTHAPSLDEANRTLMARTVLGSACVDTVHLALEAVGGRAFHRGHDLERCLRDVSAVRYHPLPRRRQLGFSGRVALGLDPIGGAGTTAHPR